MRNMKECAGMNYKLPRVIQVALSRPFWWEFER